MIEYLNTDLDLVSERDLAPLAGALESRGLFALHVGRNDGGTWSARFETSEQHAEAVSNVTAILEVVESLADRDASEWRACSIRLIDIGYSASLESETLEAHLEQALVARLASVGASLRFTMYTGDPDRAAIPSTDEAGPVE
jgi:hypothetical protein